MIGLCTTLRILSFGTRPTMKIQLIYKKERKLMTQLKLIVIHLIIYEVTYLQSSNGNFSILFPCNKMVSNEG